MFCNICIEELNESEIKKCLFCDYITCENCLKKYILDTKKTEKSCMNCKNIFLRSTLIKIFGVKFINTIYKEHIKNLLYEEQCIEIPKILPEVVKLKEIKKIMNDKNSLEKKLKKIENTNSLEYILEKHKINGYKEYLSNLRLIKVTIKKEYKYPCASNNCMGFVDSKWYCSLCEKTTCNKCHILKNDNHVCLNDDIETALHIKNNSKACPSCNIAIIKSNGCDQMWCANCHTVFDWKTGIIKKNIVIHNPEYFRYMRDNNLKIARNPNDGCDNELFRSYRSLNELRKKINNNEVDKLTNFYRRILHLENVELVEKREKINNRNIKYDKERIRYVMEEIKEKQYKTNLMSKFKLFEYLNEAMSIDVTLLEICKSTFIELIKILNDMYVNKVDFTKINVSELSILINYNKFTDDIRLEFENINNIYGYKSYKLYIPSVE